MALAVGVRCKLAQEIELVPRVVVSASGPGATGPTTMASNVCMAAGTQGIVTWAELGQLSAKDLAAFRQGIEDDVQQVEEELSRNVGEPEAGDTEDPWAQERQEDRRDPQASARHPIGDLPRTARQRHHPQGPERPLPDRGIIPTAYRSYVLR